MSRSDVFPLVELRGGPRTFHMLVFESHNPERTVWQDVEIVGWTARFPIVLALTECKESSTPIGTLAEVAVGQLHSDESPRWQAHLKE